VHNCGAYSSKKTFPKRSWSFGFTWVTGRFQTLWSVNKHYCKWFVSPLLFLIDFSWSSVRSHSTVSTHFLHLWAAFFSGLAIRFLDHDTPVQTHQQMNTHAHIEGEKRRNSPFFQHSFSKCEKYIKLDTTVCAELWGTLIFW